MQHFLARAHRQMRYYGNGDLWLPGSTTWMHYISVSPRTIRRAQQRGYLTRGGGFPQLTATGYQQF